MPWVRGHYRRPRLGSSASGAGCAVLGAGLLALIGAIASAVAAALSAAGDYVKANATALLTFGAIGAVVVVGGLGWRWWARFKRNRDLERLAELAQHLAGSTRPNSETIGELRAVRLRLGTLPQQSREYLESLYRWAVGEAVRDHQVTRTERLHLRELADGLGLTDDVVRRMNVEGFLEGFSRLIADGRLASQEEAQLTDLREALRVPEEAVRGQLAQAGQLRRAREVAETVPQVVSVPVKLRSGEVCYHSVTFTEKRSKVSRSFVQNGVRHTERDLVPVRSGQLYVTNERLLLVADGTTNIKLDSVLDTAVDTEGGVLVVTVDGRKAPFYLEVPEPFVTEAVIARVENAD